MNLFERTEEQVIENQTVIDEQFALAFKALKSNGLIELSNIIKNVKSNNFFNANYENLFKFAKLMFSGKQYNHCITFLVKILETEPENLETLRLMGKCFFEINRYDIAMFYLKKIEAIDPDCSITLRDIGLTLIVLSDLGGAEKYLNRSMELDPENPKTYHAFASLRSDQGRMDEALQMIQRSVAIDPKNCLPYKVLASLKKFTTEDMVQIDYMESLASDKEICDDDRVFVAFALGKAFADIKNYDKSLQYYHMANRIKKKYVDPGLEVFEKQAKRYSDVFSKNSISKRKAYASASKVPIFIVGMPRSGTTLTEQIISCHSKIHGAGEVCSFDYVVERMKDKKISGHFLPVPFPESFPHLEKNELKTLADFYIGAISKGVKTGCKISNKVPANFLHIGFILALFPNATIIHCKRHPLDIFLSIYFHNFVYVPYSYDPQMIVRYYKTYDKLMKYWKEQFADCIHDSYYEELVCKQEEKSRELIRFCGLKWEDQCLDFHKNKRQVSTASSTQVRQKLYSSSMYKWKNYEEFLGPVKEALVQEIVEYENELEKRLNS